PDGVTPQHTVVFCAQFQNVSQGLFPDGAVGSTWLMTNWTPRAANRLGLPPSPRILALVSGLGVFRLTVSTTAGRSYVVEYADHLDAPTWTQLGGGRPATADTLMLAA